MIGDKIYWKRSQAYFFLFMYALLAVIGGAMCAREVLNDRNPGNAAGFMLVFGAGMFISTLIKSRKPRITVSADFLELAQRRTKQLVRYRYITAVERPSKNTIVLTLREDGPKSEVAIRLNELDKADGERLYDFLSNRRWKQK